MSWLARALEERLAQAAANGELDAPTLAGRPIEDLDRPRRPGWWAEQFVERELSHDRRAVAEREAATARAGFWRCDDVDSLRAAIQAANAAIDAANARLVDADRLQRFDDADVVARWNRLRR